LQAVFLGLRFLVWRINARAMHFRGVDAAVAEILRRSPGQAEAPLRAAGYSLDRLEDMARGVAPAREAGLIEGLLAAEEAAVEARAAAERLRLAAPPVGARAGGPAAGAVESVQSLGSPALDPREAARRLMADGRDATGFVCTGSWCSAARSRPRGKRRRRVYSTNT
jgi:hypothetical protein